MRRILLLAAVVTFMFAVPAWGADASLSSSATRTIAAALLNMGGTLVIVSLLKNMVMPSLAAAAPWSLPLIAAFVGPILVMLQNWLGMSVDLSPVLAVFTGASATAAHQVFKQTR